MLKKLKEKKYFWVLKNLFFLIIAIPGLIFGFALFLRLVTQHGREVTVPDMRYMSVADASKIADDADLELVVIDSIYNKRLPRGYVDVQFPAPGKQVKHDRKIRVIINARSPRTVSMPDLKGMSLRQAMNELASKHLEVGQLIYRQDMATNNVLDQRIGNSAAVPGRKIECGTAVDLVLGLNSSSSTTTVPSVISMQYEDAVKDIKASSLNVSTIVYDESVKSYEDTLKAVVYRQGPTASKAPITKGSSVSLYLTVDPERLPK
ncbi:MAG: PASTA domain-containing protein [Bacteroidales bacterium]|nr:PASTA domain-containing protein [Bacteroidales bacterium]